MAFSNQVVVKSNELIQASHKLSLDEQRLVLLCISKIDSTKSLSSDSFFRISGEEFATRYNIELNNSYIQLRAVAQNLLSRKIRFVGKDSDGINERILEVPWSTGSAYIEKKGAVEIRFAPEVIPHLTNLKNKFTSYNLEHITKMTSSYAIRIYELLIQYKNMGTRERYISIEELRQYLDIKKSDYKRIFDFKKRVIKIANEQINEFSDIELKIEDKKEGRNIAGFVFKFNFKEHLVRKVSQKKVSDALSSMISRLEVETQELPLS